MTYTSSLPQIAGKIADVLDGAAKEAAEEIERRAKDRVHVGTGRLRDAIHTERLGKGEYSVIAGNDHVFHGHLVEHGDSNSPPRPFLVPAFEESRGHAVNLMAAALRKLT